MMTYALLNAIFLTAAALLLLKRRTQVAGKWRQIWQVLLFLLALTLIFDNVIILLGIVSYHSEQIAGLYLYRAPIEDFAYTIGALLIVVSLWEVGREE